MSAKPENEELVVAIPVLVVDWPVKPELVESWTAYDAAPVEAFQLTVTEVPCPFEPLAGRERIGAAGIGGMVVKDQTLDHALEPLEFTARTFQ